VHAGGRPVGAEIAALDATDAVLSQHLKRSIFTPESYLPRLSTAAIITVRIRSLSTPIAGPITSGYPPHLGPANSDDSARSSPSRRDRKGDPTHAPSPPYVAHHANECTVLIIPAMTAFIRTCFSPGSPLVGNWFGTGRGRGPNRSSSGLYSADCWQADDQNGRHGS
jgi:hypothetical protein